MAAYAILVDGEVKVISFDEYLASLKVNREDDGWRIGYDTVNDATVSTVFLGLNHAFRPDDPPMWFETLVFGGELDGEGGRYTTLAEAKAGHEAMVKRVRQTYAVVVITLEDQIKAVLPIIREVGNDVESLRAYADTLESLIYECATLSSVMLSGVADGEKIYKAIHAKFDKAG